MGDETLTRNNVLKAFLRATQTEKRAIRLVLSEAYYSHMIIVSATVDSIRGIAVFQETEPTFLFSECECARKAERCRFLEFESLCIPTVLFDSK